MIKTPTQHSWAQDAKTGSQLNIWQLAHNPIRFSGKNKDSEDGGLKSFGQNLFPAFAAFPRLNDRFEFRVRAMISAAGILAKPISTIRASDELALSHANPSDANIRQKDQVACSARQLDDQKPAFGINAVKGEHVERQSA